MSGFLLALSGGKIGKNAPIIPPHSEIILTIEWNGQIWQVFLLSFIGKYLAVWTKKLLEVLKEIRNKIFVLLPTKKFHREATKWAAFSVETTTKLIHDREQIVSYSLQFSWSRCQITLLLLIILCPWITFTWGYKKSTEGQ